MKVYKPKDFRRLEEWYCERAGITLSALMDRAIIGFTDRILPEIRYDKSPEILVLAGPGNNGGDAVGVAGNMKRLGFKTSLILISFGDALSELLEEQLDNLPKGVEILDWKRDKEKYINWQGDYIIDGIFGYGLNRPLTGEILTFVKWLNGLNAERYAIDIPSGMYADFRSSDYAFQADYTFTFHSPKPSFFLEENESWLGEWEVVEIGIGESGFKPQEAVYSWFRNKDAQEILPKREKFAHKGSFGHCLLISGQKGMSGCTVLSAGACLRSGAGRLTIHAPSSANDILQITIPEAMVSLDKEENFIANLPDLSPYSVIGIGPGIGTKDETVVFVEQLLKERTVPLVLDADALNIMSKMDRWKETLGINDVILPHPGEFDRLFGKHISHLERIKTIEMITGQYPFTIVLKGAHTVVAQKGELMSFNTSGNPGMASGGSGDVLTGMLMGYIAQGMSTYNAARLAVYVHGLSADIYTREKDSSTLIAGDIIENIGKVVKQIKSHEEEEKI